METTISQYKVEGYNFEEATQELATGGYNVTIKNIETEEVLVNKTVYSITKLIEFYEHTRPQVIVEWVLEKQEVEHNGQD